VLVATSYGALVARMYANEYPDDERVDFEAALDGVVAHRDAQDASQRRVAQLVPDAEHITETYSGHDIMLENPEPVSQAIGDVIAAVRDGRTSVES
jgi:pimeloyl-ACP methyl ester carboxylesterase